MSDLLVRIQQGDKEAFKALVRLHHQPMLNIATAALSNPSSAEEVVQETWIAIIKGVGRFEGRSTLKTWVFAILMNQTRKRMKKDGRHLWVDDRDDLDPLSGRFRADGHWDAKVCEWWKTTPEQNAAHRQLMALVQDGINALPDQQRVIMLLSDLEGFSGPEVSRILDISEANQRVSLHRARTAVRVHVEHALKEKI